MALRGIWPRWQALNPAPRRYVGLVVGPGDVVGTTLVRIPPVETGGLQTVSGSGYEEGAKVFVLDGKIEGEAPDLLVVEVEV